MKTVASTLGRVRLCRTLNRFGARLSLALPLLIFSGCSLPHRRAAATHTIEVFHCRPDGLISRESWQDSEGGGGFFFFADPHVQAMTAIHTNQCALGGGSAFSAGSMMILVDSNLVPAITATGTAAGNIIGAAAKSAVK